MATNQSTEKILKYIQEQENPVTKTEIVVACALPSASVGECISLLDRFGKIEIITNGKTMLIRKMKSVRDATNN